ncbi:MAG: hypothetical protein GF401_06305 [Chitinivibrionales bacterium]|nr:hypothetical protein [Chitinivibrionales bacterium]
MSKEQAYFVSDAHLGIFIPNHEQREKHLLTFFREISSHATHVFILGDLFDFWIEYKYSIRPDYFPALHTLRNMVEKGVNIHYIAGNHDFAIGPFLQETIGLHIHCDHAEMELQGKRIHLFHGDGLLKADISYRMLRKILRNKTNQRLYRLLHPNIAVPLATFFSGNSRKFLSLCLCADKIKEYRVHGKRILDTGKDIVVFGHTHHPELIRWGDKCYCNTGEWIRKYTYAKLEKGIMTSWQYFPDKAPQRLPETTAGGAFSSRE